MPRNAGIASGIYEAGELDRAARRMGALILDASVLIGPLDSADAQHERAVADVERADASGQTLVTPASAYGEALVAFTREHRIADVREAIASMGITVEPLTGPVAEQGRGSARRAHAPAPARRDGPRVRARWMASF